MSNVWKVVRVLAVVVGVFFAALVLDRAADFLKPPAPPAQPIKQAPWLEQGWSSSERYWFHHATKGTLVHTDPLRLVRGPGRTARSRRSGPSGCCRATPTCRSWASSPAPSPGPATRRATATPRRSSWGGGTPGARPCSARTRTACPVGFAITRAYKDPTSQQMLPDQIGLTCAACHTGHLEYNGVSLRIDGANASTSLSQLTKAATAALLLTDVLPWRFKTFADRVLGPNATKEQRKALHAELKKTLKTLAGQAAATARIDKKNTEEGFNRLDALNRIGNAVFYTNLAAAKAPGFDPLVNYAPVDAPVKYPHLWNTPWFSWAQYDGSIEQPAIRNVGEALGVAAKVNMTTYDDPARLWTSSVPVHNLGEMEQLIEGGNPQERLLDHRVRGFTGLASPKWPQDVLGAIDPVEAAAGRRLYAERCQGCHLPPVDDPGQALHDPAHWTPPNQYGESYLQVPLVPQRTWSAIDPGQARVLSTRKITVPLALGVQPGVTDPEDRIDLLHHAHRAPDPADVLTGPGLGGAVGRRQVPGAQGPAAERPAGRGRQRATAPTASRRWSPTRPGR